MRFPRVRITTERTMLAIFVIGVVIGVTLQVVKSGDRRADYLEIVRIADSRGEWCDSLAVKHAWSAREIRKWVEAGAEGHPPGTEGFGSKMRAGFTLNPRMAEEWRQHPDLALARADLCEQAAEQLVEQATNLARIKREAERNATFPRVFFAPSAPSPLSVTK